MKSIFYKMVLTTIVFTGLVIGLVKGQDARQKWVTKKKNRYESRLVKVEPEAETSVVMLDEFEIATYHS